MREHKLVLDQLGLALRNLRPNAWMMPALAAVICVMFHEWIATPRLAVWFAIVVLACVPLGIVARRYGHVTSVARDPRRRVLVATAAYFTFTLGWSSLGLFLWVPHNDLACLIVIMLMACTVAGNGALVGASRPLTVVSYGSYGASLVLAPLQSGGLVYDGIAILALLYIGYMMFMSRQIYLTARDMLLLRYEKNDLIDALARSKAESDKAREHAEAASRAKSQFLANMSHELRTPLNAILGFSEMITSRMFADKPEKQHEYAGLIHSSGAHLLTLINDILDLAKIESGSWRLREKDVDLGALIADACTMMAPRATAGGCTLLTEIDAGLPLLVCDERALMQMLLNLTSNAVKFTPPNGRITVFAHLLPNGEICLGVSDTGVGIAKEDQGRVFENFGQGQHDVVATDKGTGLGLPIVKGLVEAHGGRITLASEIGEGTTVTVYFPAGRVSMDAARKAAS
ncbi:MAG TPA: HAMP domain-containing sensor histidine kinase [Rhizomicrobium sp.]|jgi:two-component system cell cycle sensor histidine kinase PleC|nr:HAMP domain-containing sensor histidine kinase [Rhizomicrobium sp.]